LRLGAAPERPAAVLAELLSGDELGASIIAYRCLLRLDRPVPQLTARLRKVLRHDDEAVRLQAAIVLCHLRDDAPEALALLRKQLRATDRHTFPGSELLWALVRLGPRAAPAIPDLLAAFEAQPIRNVLYPLGRMGPAGRPAVPFLRKVLLRADLDREGEAAEALEGIGPAAAEALPELMAMLRSADDVDRIAAARALGAMGPAARAAVPRLEALLRDGPGPRPFAHAALFRITGDREKHLAPLLCLLGAAPGAAEALRYLGPPALDVLPELAAVAQASDRAVGDDAVRVLGNLGPQAAAALPVLVELLRHPNYETREAAADALGKLGPAALPALPRLRALSEDGVLVALAADVAVYKIKSAQHRKR
jgi:HEAT repeat protein